MEQPDGSIAKGREKLVCMLKKYIYRLKQASRSQNLHFDPTIKDNGFIQDVDNPCVCKKTLWYTYLCG